MKRASVKIPGNSTYLAQQVFVEIYELEIPGVEGVSRRENVTHMSDEKRRETALHFAGRIDRSLYGVRIARYTVEVYETF